METTRWMEALHPESPIREYLQWIGESGNDALFRKKYAAVVEAQKGEKGCFLSVIIRTQGKRIEMLQDVLTCLQAQSDPDFEVLIICHRAEQDAVKAVEALVRNQAEAFRGKTRILSSDDGERGAPLNLGFAAARGRYAACLDDDDLAMDHWVASFHAAEEEHGGMILHSWAMTQQWAADPFSADGRQQLRAVGSPDAKYCVPYRTMNQQNENQCPFMGLAFPLFLFRDMHVMFNEEIRATEDWDYLLRTAGIAGVWDICETTAIYRMWNTRDASRQLIREPEWQENYRQTHGRMWNIPLLLTAKEAGACREELTGLQSAGQKGRSCFMWQAVVFWTGDEEFDDSRHATAPILMKDGWIRVQFSIRERMRGKEVTRIRIDPAPETLFTLEHAKIRLIDGEKEIGSLGSGNIRGTNGIMEGESILFLMDHPWIEYLSEDPIPPCTVEFTARVTYHSPAALSRWAEDLCADERWLADHRNVAHLYIDRGEGVDSDDSEECTRVFRGETYRAVFDISAKKGDNIRGLRFDPTEVGMLWMDGFVARVQYMDGSEAVLHAGEIRRMNGFAAGNGLAFIGRDPNMMIPVQEDRQPIRVEVTANARLIRAEEMEDLFAAASYVPDYGLICGQLREMRQNRWKEEAGDGHGA